MILPDITTEAKQSAYCWSSAHEEAVFGAPLGGTERVFTPAQGRAQAQPASVRAESEPRTELLHRYTKGARSSGVVASTVRNAATSMCVLASRLVVACKVGNRNKNAKLAACHAQGRHRGGWAPS